MSTAETVPDAQLLAGWVERGDRGALDTLVRRHEQRVYALCLRYFRDPVLAQDAMQDAFVLLVRRAGTFRGSAQVSTWLHRITVNACHDLARKQARRPEDPAELEEQPDLVATDDVLARHELTLTLRDALAQLDDESRRMVVLRDVVGHSYAEIAGDHGVAVGTVKSRVHRAHARLAVILHQGEQDRERPAPSERHSG